MGAEEVAEGGFVAEALFDAVASADGGGFVGGPQGAAEGAELGGQVEWGLGRHGESLQARTKRRVRQNDCGQNDRRRKDWSGGEAKDESRGAPQPEPEESGKGMGGKGIGEDKTA